MKRISTLNSGYYNTKPMQADFESYDSHILIDKIVKLYFINDNDNVEMIHAHHFDVCAMMHQMPTINTILCKYFDQLPEEFWQTLKQRLKIKNNTKRITVFQKWYLNIKPTRADFDSHDTQMLLGGLLTTYFISDQDEINTIYIHELDEWARTKYTMPSLDCMLSQHFELLSEEFWQTLKQEFKIR